MPFPLTQAPTKKRYSQTIRREIRHRARREGVCLLYDNTPIAAILVIPLSLIIAAWMRPIVEGNAIGLWLIAVNGIVLLRLLLYAGFKNFEKKLSIHGWENVFSLLVFLAGLAWGAFAWLPGVKESSDGSLALVKEIVILAILVIGSSSLLGSRIAFTSYLVGVLSPLLVWLAITSSEIFVIFGVGAMVISALLFFNFRSQHDSLLSAFVKRYEARELLRQQQVIFDSVVEGIILVRSRPERIVKCNRRFATLLGLSYETMRTNVPWVWYGSRESWRQLMVASWPVISTGHPYQVRRQLKRKNGSLFWAEITGTAVDPQNLDVGVVWVVADIDTRLAAENALRLSEQRFRDLVSLSSDIYWVIDQNGKVGQVTGDSIEHDFIPVDLVIGYEFWNIPVMSGVTDSVWIKQKEIFANHEPFREFIFRLKGTDRKERWYSVSGTPLFDNNEQFIGYHGAATNITTRILNEERYRHLAYHDTLTGLPNRRLLEDRLDQALQFARRKKHRLGILVIDLDGFKPVNDQYGHAVGDILLEKVATQLRASVRQMDTVSRVGGDEFVVLLPELSASADALLVANKIHELFAQLELKDFPKIRIGASIGISLFPKHGLTPEDLFLHADAAMYAAKSQGGRKTCIYEPPPPATTGS